MKRLLSKPITLMLRRRGFSPFMSRVLVADLAKDLFANGETSLKQKIWAYRRGFLSANMINYGLTEKNYQEYVSDFAYLKSHPINKEFSAWIDDKLTTKYILHPFNEFLPEYYYQISAEKILKLPDCPLDYACTVDGMMELLKDKKQLALKQISGSLGIGFYRLDCLDGAYAINLEPVADGRMRELLQKSHHYLLTEYITAHQEIKRIYGGSPNTVRVMVVNNDDGPKILRAFIRFGTNATKAVDNATTGGIVALIDVTTGKYYNGAKLLNHKIVQSGKHPDTGEIIEGIIPHWSLVKEKIVNISNYIPQLIYIGFDVVITDTGFKILELNSHQGIKFHQYYAPLGNTEFFRTLIK